MNILKFRAHFALCQKILIVYDFGILGCLLVSHCVYLVIEHQDSDEFLDTILRLICIVRIVCAVPRPYFWFHTRKQFIEARYQPTPQLVSQRLLGIYANPFRIERALLMFYYLWLIVVFVLVEEKFLRPKGAKSFG